MMNRLGMASRDLGIHLNEDWEIADNKISVFGVRPRTSVVCDEDRVMSG